MASDPHSACGGTTKPQADSDSPEQATQHREPGGAGQADPGHGEDDDLSYNPNSDSHNSNDRGTESSPSCGWRGVCNEFHVTPGR